MECSNCGNKEAFRIIVTSAMEMCDKCGDVKATWMPDVFWNGKPEPFLADDANGKPMSFSGKREKAVYLREHGLWEAGDKIRGDYPKCNSTREIDHAQSKREVKMALQKVRNMGRDVRRQAYLKIVKQTRGKF